MLEFLHWLGRQSHFVGALTVEVIFLRLGLAVLFGGLVGLERERHHKPAGFRTYILVCLGAASVSLLQDQLRLELLALPSVPRSMTLDLGRLGAQVISGIGFLGAGSILIKSRNEGIIGLTTAAGIWATGCVGLAIGWGFYPIALVAIVLMLAIMMLKRVELQLLPRPGLWRLTLSYRANVSAEALLPLCAELCRAQNLALGHIDKDPAGRRLTLELIEVSPPARQALLLALAQREEILTVDSE